MLFHLQFTFIYCWKTFTWLLNEGQSPLLFRVRLIRSLQESLVTLLGTGQNQSLRAWTVLGRITNVPGSVVWLHLLNTHLEGWILTQCTCYQFTSANYGNLNRPWGETSKALAKTLASGPCGISPRLGTVCFNNHKLMYNHKQHFLVTFQWQDCFPLPSCIYSISFMVGGGRKRDYDGSPGSCPPLSVFLRLLPD